MEEFITLGKNHASKNKYRDRIDFYYLIESKGHTTPMLLFAQMIAPMKPDIDEQDTC